MMSSVRSMRQKAERVVIVVVLALAHWACPNQLGGRAGRWNRTDASISSHHHFLRVANPKMRVNVYYFVQISNAKKVRSFVIILFVVVVAVVRYQVSSVSCRATALATTDREGSCDPVCLSAAAKVACCSFRGKSARTMSRNAPPPQLRREAEDTHLRWPLLRVSFSPFGDARHSFLFSLILICQSIDST